MHPIQYGSLTPQEDSVKSRALPNIVCCVIAAYVQIIVGFCLEISEANLSLNYWCAIESVHYSHLALASEILRAPQIKQGNCQSE